MESSFSWTVLVTPPTSADLSKDLRVATRASAAAPTRSEAREVGALRRQWDMRPDGNASDTGLALKTAPTAGTGIPSDSAQQATAFRPSPNS